jgi:sec-independent protein translocase protein TatC
MTLPERFRRRKVPNEERGRMTLLEHLRELRHRVIVSVVAIFIGAVVAYFLYDHILAFLERPYCHVLRVNHVKQACTLQVFDPLGKLTNRLKISFFSGAALALPVILWQLWRFITPGLHPSEKRYALPFVLSSLAFFAFGAWVALTTLPYALGFFQAVGGKGVGTFYALDPYIRLVTLMIIAYGVAFEFPVLLVALELVGVVPSRKLRSWRRGAIVGITVFAAVFTPSSDPFSMFAMAIPMYVFYEGAILTGRVLKK